MALNGQDLPLCTPVFLKRGTGHIEKSEYTLLGDRPQRHTTQVLDDATWRVT